MKSIVRFTLMSAVAGAIAVGGTSAAVAQSRPTPKDWNYEIRNGQRVPKGGNRVTNADGSWREEIRQGSCVTIKEKTANGEYKEVRRCD
ncbi:hypothetical protein ACFQPG_01250 [Sphingomonas sp. GCM10030256]|uniref:hypothetical protein n=1 Tax=Sphingomonas sp. GCM10030256 TaxID=3273427 RepID=UPI00361B1ACD